MGCEKGLVCFIIQMLIRISNDRLECKGKVAMDTYREVLQIIARAPHPIGWHGIELRLGMKGVVLDENLIKVLHALVDKDFLIHEEAPGHSHGVYRLTQAGKEYLEHQ